MGAFRSIGSVTAGFNTSISPGAPPGAQAGDILVVGYVQHAGSAAAPDLSAFGFTQKSDNSIVKAAVLYTKTAVGSDTMPSANFGGDFQCCFCAAYTGLTETLDRVSVARGGNTTSGITIPSATAPPSDNVVAVCLAMRNNTTATGASISDYGAFTQRATNIPNSNGRPMATFEDIVMTATQAITLGSQGTSPADSGANTCGSVIIFLQSIATALPVGDAELPTKIQPKPYSPGLYDFYQMSLGLRTVVPQPPPPSPVENSVPRGRPFPNSLRDHSQNLLESTLFGKDRVLTSVDWDYGFPSASDRLPACFRDESQGLTANDMTFLSNVPPYIEYNWPNPQIARRLNQSYEYGVPLPLVGQDKLLNSGPQNNMWDPPKGRPFPVSLRSFEQSGLALFNTIPVKPPVSEGGLPPPLQVRRPVQDFIAGMPLTILNALTTFPPKTAAPEMPVRRPFSTAYDGFSSSILPLYAPVQPLPPGSSDQSLPRRPGWQNNLYEISFRSNFLIPSPPPPPTQPGVVAGPGGRTILLPKKQGETVTRPFDFISRLGAGEVLTSAIVLASVYSGTDSNPSAIIYGGASVLGTIVYQGITGGVTGVIYELLCKVTTSLGQTLEMAAFWVVEPDLP